MNVKVRANVSHHGLLGKWRDEWDGFRLTRGFWLREHMAETMDAMRFLFEEPYYTDQRHDSFGGALFYLMRMGQYGCSFE